MDHDVMFAQVQELMAFKRRVMPMLEEYEAHRASQVRRTVIEVDAEALNEARGKAGELVANVEYRLAQRPPDEQGAEVQAAADSLKAAMEAKDVDQMRERTEHLATLADALPAEPPDHPAPEPEPEPKEAELA